MTPLRQPPALSKEIDAIPMMCTRGTLAAMLTCRWCRTQVEMLQFLATVARGPAQKVEVRVLLHAAGLHESALG